MLPLFPIGWLEEEVRKIIEIRQTVPFNWESRSGSMLRTYYLGYWGRKFSGYFTVNSRDWINIRPQSSSRPWIKIHKNAFEFRHQGFMMNIPLPLDLSLHLEFFIIDIHPTTWLLLRTVHTSEQSSPSSDQSSRAELAAASTRGKKVREHSSLVFRHEISQLVKQSSPVGKQSSLSRVQLFEVIFCARVRQLANSYPSSKKLPMSLFSLQFLSKLKLIMTTSIPISTSSALRGKLVNWNVQSANLYSRQAIRLFLL